MRDWIRNVLDWGRRLAWLWALLVPSGIVGIVTGWIAYGTHWLNQYGAIAWWVAGLAGFMISSFALGGFAWLRLLWIKGSAIRKWKRDVDSINPLDSEFTKQRILVRDIANPITRFIEEKKFTDCELIGPANIFFVSDVEMYGTGFVNCDLVPVRNNVAMANVIGLKKIKMTHGRVYNCTIFFPLELSDKMLSVPNSIAVALTGNLAYDSRKSPGLLNS